MSTGGKKDHKGFGFNVACVLAVAAVTWPPFKVLSVYGVLIAPLIVSWRVLSREESLLRLTQNKGCLSGVYGLPKQHEDVLVTYKSKFQRALAFFSSTLTFPSRPTKSGLPPRHRVSCRLYPMLCSL